MNVLRASGRSLAIMALRAAQRATVQQAPSGQRRSHYVYVDRTDKGLTYAVVKTGDSDVNAYTLLSGLQRGVGRQVKKLEGDDRFKGSVAAESRVRLVGSLTKTFRTSDVAVIGGIPEGEALSMCIDLGERAKGTIVYLPRTVEHVTSVEILEVAADRVVVCVPGAFAKPEHKGRVAGYASHAPFLPDDRKLLEVLLYCRGLPWVKHPTAFYIAAVNAMEAQRSVHRGGLTERGKYPAPEEYDHCFAPPVKVEDVEE